MTRNDGKSSSSAIAPSSRRTSRPWRNCSTLLKAGPVTLLYGARDVEHNQAVVLAGYIRELARSR